VPFWKIYEHFTFIYYNLLKLLDLLKEGPNWENGPAIL